MISVSGAAFNVASYVIVSFLLSGIVRLIFCPVSVISIFGEIPVMRFPFLSFTTIESVSNWSGDFISSTKVIVSSPLIRSSPDSLTVIINGSFPSLISCFVFLIVFLLTFAVAVLLEMIFPSSFFTVIVLLKLFVFPSSKTSSSLTLVTT